jgi:hypothetical protein
MKASKISRAFGRLAAIGAVAVLPACARSTAANVAPAVGPLASAPPSARRDSWSESSWEERHDQMTWLVHPDMAKLFQRFEKTPYPELTCRTCHGADAEQVQYKMPNGLPALDPLHMPDPNSGPDAEITKFMYDEVTPRMADLLGVDLRDPRTGRGFGCFSCHPVDR